MLEQNGINHEVELTGCKPLAWDDDLMRKINRHNKNKVRSCILLTLSVH